ncbi:uncharacterized [Tachysurus ichikawai]
MSDVIAMEAMRRRRDARALLALPLGMSSYNELPSRTFGDSTWAESGGMKKSVKSKSTGSTGCMLCINQHQHSLSTPTSTNKHQHSPSTPTFTTKHHHSPSTPKFSIKHQHPPPNTNMPHKTPTFSTKHQHFPSNPNNYY